MKIVCIDNNLKRSGDLIDPIKLGLTIGKVYETSGGPAAQYTITCDDGVIRDYSVGRFVTLEEWREKQLNKILEDGEN